MKSRIIALDVGLVTGNALAMTVFYRDVLEARPAGEVTLPGVGLLRKFECGGGTLKILEPTNAPERDRRGGGFAAVAGIRYLSLAVEDIAAMLGRCRQAGVKVLVELTTVRPGVTAAMVEDPDGNAVELMETR